MSMNLLIIGTGIAALSAAEAIRKGNNGAAITMLGEDPHLPYFRIKLSHLLAKQAVTPEQVLVKPASWYKENRITVQTGTRVRHIDFSEKTVQTEKGGIIGYDRLLLATGATPFVPPIPGREAPGVFTLRTLDDLVLLQKALQQRHRVVVVGGGLLGLEAAHALMQLGKQVHVVESLPYLLPRQLDRQTAQGIRRQLEQEGLTFTVGTACERIEGNPAVTGLRMADGSLIPADVLLLSTGVRPDVSLFEGTPLAVGRGIVVDTHLRTSLPDVYAAGDVAEADGRLYGLWAPAMEQGKIAGANMAGEEASFTPLQPAATLSVGRVKLFSAGEIGEADLCLRHETPDVFHRLYAREGRVAGIVLTGDLSLAGKAKGLVLQRAHLPGEASGNVTFHDLFR